MMTPLWTSIFVFLMALVFYFDLTSMRIFNWLNGLIAGAYFVAAFSTGMPLASIGWAIVAATIGFAIMLVPFSMNALGGGDVKFVPAALLWFGWTPHALAFFVQFSIFGGALTLLVLSLRAMPLPAAVHGYTWTNRLLQPRGMIPYGVAMAAAGIYLSPFILQH